MDQETRESSLKEIFDNYTTKSLEYILNQAEKKLDETVLSFGMLSKINLTAFIFYWINACIFIAKIQSETSIYLFCIYCIMLISAISCLYFAYKNLFPKHLYLLGINPETLIDKYFLSGPNNESQYKMYITWHIACLKGNIKSNESINSKRIKAFKTGIRIACISGLLFSIHVIIYRIVKFQ